MITVEARLSAALRDQLGIADTKPMPVELPADSTLPDLYRLLGLAPEQVAFTTVNNRYPNEGYRLQDGDHLRIVARAVGG